MRRLLLILAALVVSAGVFAKDKSSKGSAVSAHFGFQGGIDVNKIDTWTAEKKIPGIGWHAGATFLLNLPCFLAIQPSVLFAQQNSGVRMEMEGLYAGVQANNINVPIAIQWGPDLAVCRPYVMVVPYLDFMLDARLKDIDGNWQNVKEHFNTTQFGLGTGVGLDVWRLQISLRYNWGFGDWAKETIPGYMHFGDHRQSLTLSMAVLF